jgi:hypothetical protein
LQALFLCDDDETLPDQEDQEEQEEVEVAASNAASVTVDARSVLSSCSGDVSLGFEDQTVSQEGKPSAQEFQYLKFAMRITGVVGGQKKQVKIKSIQILSRRNKCEFSLIMISRSRFFLLRSTLYNYVEHSMSDTDGITT